MSNSQTTNPHIESLITEYGSPERMIKLRDKVFDILATAFAMADKLEKEKKTNVDEA